MNRQITIDDRREPNPNIVPLIERRGGEARRIPTWLQRARAGALYGYDADGRPVAGKSMDGRAA